jgi:transposase
MHGTMAPVEVITSVQRRRRWTAEEKQRIVAQSARPGTAPSQVARAHGISSGQLFTWRRQFLAAAVGAVGEAGFVPVQIANGSAVPHLAGSEPVAGSRSALRSEGCIEIKLPGGIAISVGKDVDVETLRRVVAALLVR